MLRYFHRVILRTIVTIFFVITAIMPVSTSAQSQFAEGENFLEEVVLRDLPISTALAFATPERAYLALKVGIVRVVDKGKLLPTPFLDLQAIVNKTTDRGLLGIAVDPDFPQRPFIYLSYVYDPPGSTPDSGDPRVIQVSRVTADASKDYTVALPGSLEVLVGRNSTLENTAPPVPLGDPNIPERASCMTGLTMDGTPIEDCIACDATSHTAGTLMFGPNRALFASLGDGADYSGPTRVGLRTQNIDSLSGRVLRIDPDTGKGLPDNPWYQPDAPRSNRSRTWSFGFRNPFRITLKPQSESVFMGDVGTSYYEEINSGKGINFGWPCYEGGFLDRAQKEGEATASMQQVGYRSHPRTIEFCNQMYAQGQGIVTKPLYNYRHPYDETGKDLGASITGLAFYEGRVYPDKYRGALFFADYAQRFIRYLTFDAAGKPTAHDFATEVGSNLGAVELFSGPDKNIYAVYIDLKTRTSQVRRFKSVGAGNSPPVIRASVSPTSGAKPLVVNASASKSYDPDGQSISFLWDFGDGTTSSDAETIHVYPEAGTYDVTVTVTEASAPFASSKESFTVRSGQTLPVARITEPLPGTTFEIGVPVRFSGSATTDSPDNLTLSWNILQIHNEHTHLVSEVEGEQGSFIPKEHADNTAYELCLLASIGEGLSDQKCVTIQPRTAPHIFQSEPSGATISYLDEELDVRTPYIAQPIVGSEQSIRASLIYEGRSFLGWADGYRDSVRSFTTTRSPAVFKALYINKPPRVSIAQGSLKSSRSRKSLVLDASISSDPEGQPLTYAWRFSDGKRFSSGSIQRGFRKEGRYRFTLVVKDRLGAETRTRRTIIVTNARGARLK
jgi:glucose/arabinose dehydrogenase/PKD repeat protein